jgi:UDP-N-acetyl-2-amino-2-deoxyglucuronate dehydrogenase
LALRNDCDAICEKPLVIKPKNLKYLKALEKEVNRKIYGILQLRHHPTILQVRDEYKNSKKKVDIDLSYITSRGQWYHQSWKGDESKSGGLAVNIGIHFFDMLIWIFGDVVENIILNKTNYSINGILILERANIRWNLSVDASTLPKDIIDSGQHAYRSIVIDGKSLEFSDGFTDLHTIAYREILNGNGFVVDDTMPALRVVNEISEWKG